MRFHCIRQPHLDEIHLIMSERSGAGKVAIVKEIIMETVDAGSMAPSSPLRLQNDDAQVLMDELYACGLRPTGAAGTIGQLGAMQQHLDDLRRLVFKEKKADEPATTKW